MAGAGDQFGVHQRQQRHEGAQHQSHGVMRNESRLRRPIDRVLRCPRSASTARTRSTSAIWLHARPRLAMLSTVMMSGGQEEENASLERAEPQPLERTRLERHDESDEAQSIHRRGSQEGKEREDAERTHHSTALLPDGRHKLAGF